MSRPLTVRLMRAACALITHNPWRCAIQLSSLPDETVSSAGHRNGPSDERDSWLRSMRDLYLEPMLDAIEDTTDPLVSLVEAASLSLRGIGALLRRLVRAAPAHANTSVASMGGGDQVHTDKKAAAFARMLRSQLTAPAPCHGNHTAAGSADEEAAWTAAQLIQVVVTNDCSDSECRALLSCQLMPPTDASERTVSTLAALVATGRSSGCIDRREPPDPAPLRLLASAAALVPTLVYRSLPLDYLQRELETALSIATARCATAALVELFAAALRHRVDGTEPLFEFLNARGADLAIAGAADPLVAALHTYPLRLARAALARIVDAIHDRALAAEHGAAEGLMRLLGAAASHLARTVHSELRIQHREQLPCTGTITSESKKEEDYDYMEAEAEAVAEETAVGELLLQRLRSDALYACMPTVLAFAVHGSGREDRTDAFEEEELAARVAAVGAVGRFMHSHERLAVENLPSLLRLVAQHQPTGVRCAAILVFASLHVAFPAHTGESCTQMLRSTLRSGEPAQLRHASLTALSELVVARRLQPSAELPTLLSLVCDANDAVSSSAFTAVGRLRALEGQPRWSRLLHSSALQLGSTEPVDRYVRMLSALIPATLEGSRSQDLEQLGEALVTHLCEIAATCTAASSTTDETLRANLAALIGAWPPTDRSLTALRKALGHGGNGLLLRLAADEPAVHRGLQAHAQHARSKSAGSTLETVTELLRSIKPRGAPASETSAPAAGRCEEDSAYNTHREGDHALSLMQERAAQDAIRALKAKQSLYAMARLPDLPGACHRDTPSRPVKRRKQ
jgi:hypothetical protein